MKAVRFFFYSRGACDACWFLIVAIFLSRVLPTRSHFLSFAFRNVVGDIYPIGLELRATGRACYCCKLLDIYVAVEVPRFQ